MKSGSRAGVNIFLCFRKEGGVSLSEMSSSDSRPSDLVGILTAYTTNPRNITEILYNWSGRNDLFRNEGLALPKEQEERTQHR